jgi:anti-sigma regulatory factor (Ser/Thr protein kinase)
VALQIVLKNHPSEKQKVVRALEQFSRDHQLPASVVQAADLALEEHLTNLMSYGFADNREHQIAVRFALTSDFMIEVEDDGPPFNPLQLPAVDTTAPLEQRPIGGLGIHLIRRFMDEVAYQSEGGKNIFRMRKRLPA